MRARPLAAATVVALLGLGACTGEEAGPDPSASVSTPTPTSETPSAAPEPLVPDVPDVPDVPSVSVTEVETVTGELPVPWGMALLPDGALLVTLRDEARVVRVDLTTGEQTVLGGPGAAALADATVPGGEGGLLGVAVAPEQDDAGVLVYLFRTGVQGNEVLRTRLQGTELAEPEILFDAIPAASVHNGGALAFGPDGMLYVGTGDASAPDSAQDPDSLAGKILRLDPDGSPAPGNPVPGSALWTLGHRNVQGFGWDAQGRMYASEFGANTVDELNVVVAGENYGWPEVEGAGGLGQGFVDPVVTWATSEASPSGLAVTADGIYLAGLRGERLWRVPLARVVAGVPADPQALLTGAYGRLRGVLALPDGGLLATTSNTDGRGDPRESDDQLLRITLGG
ncbi:MAG: PQQ-dependent sugar dehydrogenase [Cellulomonadaceae bacterium]